MTQQQINLISEFQKLKTVANCYEYYDYVKIDTTCSIEYSHEFLTLYAKQNGSDILISDLNAILEYADYYNLADEEIKNVAEKNGLDFDGVSIFKITTLNELAETINKFFSVVKDLKL